MQMIKSRSYEIQERNMNAAQIALFRLEARIRNEAAPWRNYCIGKVLELAEPLQPQYEARLPH